MRWGKCTRTVLNALLPLWKKDPGLSETVELSSVIAAACLLPAMEALQQSSPVGDCGTPLASNVCAHKTN